MVRSHPVGVAVALAALAVLAAPTAARAQGGPQRQLIVEVINDHPVRSGDAAWGGGAELQLTWGGERAPVHVGVAAGFDAERHRNSGQRRLGLDADVTVQPGGERRATPYAGVGASVVRLSGGGESARVQPGVEGILGVQLAPRPQAPVAVQVELRHGVVRTQPQSTSGRVGVVLTL